MVQTEKRSLRYDFTAVEVHDMSIQLAQKNKEQVALENEAKAVQSQYASKVKVIKSEIANLSNKVSDGWERRDIEVDVEYHKPEKGKKTIIRKDNGQTYTERMESYEWNLFNQADEEQEEESAREGDDDDVQDAEVIDDESRMITNG